MGTRIGAVLGASAAALISAGLAYWIGGGGDRTLTRFGHPPPPAYASSQADPGQVVRAYEQMKEVYADRGSAGVADFAHDCGRSLASNPRALDFCLAFEVYAASLMGDGEIARAWRANAAERQLALARGALAPTEDPVARVARVRTLARQTSLQDPDLAMRPQTAKAAPHRAKPRPARAVAAATEASASQVVRAAAQPVDQPAGQSAASASATPVAEAKPRARPAAVKKASVKRARTPAAADACRRKSTAGERTVCASPALRQADAQLQAAYRRAVAAGADPDDLARDQARFRRSVNAAAPDRVAVERLYYQRTRTLEGLSESP